METAALIEFLLLLLIAASLIAMATIRLKIPYTVALVVGGFLIDLFHFRIVEQVGEGEGLLTPEVIMMLFLPALLFEAGINIHIRHLRENLIPILLFAVFGVVSATVVTGFAVHLGAGLPLMVAMVFGALIAATDPISVLALFKEMGISKRLAVLVEGESLFNDGTAVVVFGILLEAVRTGHLDPATGVGKFIFVALGGAALGVALGYVVSKITERVDNPQIEITLTTVLAYGSFLIAEHLQVSGVIATVGAGLMIGNFGAEVGMSSRTRVALWSFWEYLGFVVNSLVFLLIGIEVHISDLLSSWPAIALAVGAVLLGRLISIYALTPVANSLTDKIPRSWQHVLFWGGIHGSVSIALALSLEADFPHRREILAMTFGVVAFSIIIQGLTVKPLARRLGLEEGQEDEYDRVKVRQMAATAALAELDELEKGHVISPQICDQLRAELQEQIQQVRGEIDALHGRYRTWAEEEIKLARTRMIAAQKTVIQRATGQGLISLHTAETILAQADDELDAVTGGVANEERKSADGTGGG